MPLPRSSGVLLHPTSLPGPFGVGDLGLAAVGWVDALARAGQTWWQVLPVGPTGYGDSPYQSPSTFAGNLNLLSPELLEHDGLVTTAEVVACELPVSDRVGYEAVIPAKRRLVRAAWERFRAGDGRPDLRAEFRAFRAAGSGWLDEFALFAAVKDAHGQKPWWEWPAPLTAHDDHALRAVAEGLADEADAHRFGQFVFARQWGALREYARAKGVKVIGDLPIYVAHDSADVWANPGLFALDETRTPTAVAGVPPDYFSETGQLWGNPVYAWDAHRRTGYAWWVERMRAARALFDLVRLDHFRGLEAYWAVPYGAPTAAGGRWEPGPDAELLLAIRDRLGEVPIIAEDLGFITPGVESLRQGFGLPGMRILQFAFGGAVEPRFRPHRFDRNTVAYTGTHDNDTTAGWAAKLTAAERGDFVRYAPAAAGDPVRTLIRLGWGSVADLVLAPVQDFLGLGSEARVNTPGTISGNWRWRATAEQLADGEWVEFLREITTTYERSAV
ncbi:MAG: 4-alpha-glucanotransferase [Gemmataceae bacterium]|nr:4-alpha-glucanotransferase [Gemmataceae bacterium]